MQLWQAESDDYEGWWERELKLTAAPKIDSRFPAIPLPHLPASWQSTQYATNNIFPARCSILQKDEPKVLQFPLLNKQHRWTNQSQLWHTSKIVKILRLKEVNWGHKHFYGYSICRKMWRSVYTEPKQSPPTAATPRQLGNGPHPDSTPPQALSKGSRFSPWF